MAMGEPKTEKTSLTKTCAISAEDFVFRGMAKGQPENASTATKTGAEMQGITPVITMTSGSRDAIFKNCLNFDISHWSQSQISMSPCHIIHKTSLELANTWRVYHGARDFMRLI
ncbi:putative cytochrome P450 12c1, mitochondrial [Frankliniella fusca]|uniref:Cytochrome P450 12c1, mitochondrial n=1 Tax=Frankliniella fusca TaxID=407009 RepID=A0AAE1HBI8_9NEOP|nr:putative cytochrome P450 12c1, mitochondrial [Frankliniella fusca]